jgi:hypothetical protein
VLAVSRCGPLPRGYADRGTAVEADSIVSRDGSKHLLGVNHIPTRGSRRTLSALAASDGAA